jgi:hypothetical protein
MIKNLTPSQLLLITIAAIMLLLAAFSFYLLQDPSAPLPFAPPPATSTSIALPPTLTLITVPATRTPTRQTSYTPLAAFITPKVGTPSEVPVMSKTPMPSKTTSPRAPTSTTTVASTDTTPVVPTNTTSVVPTNTHAFTPIAPSASPSTSPAVTPTLAPGEVGVTGRMVQNGTPVANVVVEFADDVATRKATTIFGGHYWFITLAPGTNFTLTFNQSDNLRLTPTPEVASLAWIAGTLPTGVNIIDLPDFEVSINLNGILFEPQTPADGTSYSASAISLSNPIQYNWSLYSQGGTYMVQLGPNGSDVPIWSSSQLALPTFMWNGTLDDGTHITQGTYWWRVSVTKSLGNYILVVFTQQFTIKFTP